MTNFLILNLGGLEIVMLIIMVTLALVPFALMLYCLIDLMKRDFSGKQTDQVLLFILILVFPLIGSIIYLLAFKEKYALKKRATD